MVVEATQRSAGESPGKCHVVAASSNNSGLGTNPRSAPRPVRAAMVASYDAEW
jgi:hypothetical protein